MMHVVPELVDASGKVCSEQKDNIPTLQAGDKSTFTLKVTEPGNQNPLYLHYTWFDGTTDGFKPREYLSKVSVPTA
jgi:hypothetical protein